MTVCKMLNTLGSSECKSKLQVKPHQAAVSLMSIGAADKIDSEKKTGAAALMSREHAAPSGASHKGPHLRERPNET